MNQLFLLLAVAFLATSAVAEQFSYKFTLPTNLVTVGSFVNGTSLRLTMAYPSSAGLAYYPNKVSANLGFSTNFTWIPEICPPTGVGAEGCV
jgi:hypothetical protein